jgi:tetratricopeptide (TPR) repeat protein
MLLIAQHFRAFIHFHLPRVTNQGYTEVIRLDAKNAYAYHNRGLAKANYYKLVSRTENTATLGADYQGAIADYNKAIYINPGIAVFYSNRAYAYRFIDKHKEAINDYTKAIEISPDNSDFYFQRGTVYREYFNDKDSAIRDYKISESKMNPSTSSQYSWRGYVRYNYLQRYQDAINDYTKAIELNPGNADLHRDRALVYVGFKKDLLAIADYTKALDFGSGDESWRRVYYFERGRIYHRMDKYPQAIADYKKSYPKECVGTDGYSIMICENMGIIKLDSGDNQGALLNFDQIVKEGYSSPRYIYHRGLARQNFGDQEGAKQDYQAAIEKANKYNLPSEAYESYLYRGLAYFGLGKAPSAIANFTAAIKLAPNKPEAYHQRGLVYQNLRDRDNTLKDLKMADRLYLQENQLNKHRTVTQLLNKI